MGTRDFHRQVSRLPGSSAILRQPLVCGDRSEGFTVLKRRAFTSASISRYADDSKDKVQPSTGKQEDRYNGPEPSPLDNASNRSTSSTHNAIDQVKPPEPSSSSGTATSASSRDTNTKSSNIAADTQSAILERLRTAATSLPSFDGLTSSTSLSATLSSITTHTSTLLTTLRTKISHLSTQYNTHTGYSAIEDLKARISSLETALEAARTLATTAKKTYLSAVQSRSASQRETNDLLSRKSSWDERDLSQYTELLRKEHALSKQEVEAEKVLERSEAEVQACFDELMKAVMVRYHEEQIWSDRMRGMSTYGSLVVAGLNAFLFILAILLVEPYKRKKLAETFESRLVAAEQESRQLILASVDQFQHSLSSVLTPSSTPTAHTDAPTEHLTPLVPQAEEHKAAAAIQPIDAPSAAVVMEAHRKRDEERLVFASTLGVVVGAALSLIISACWS
ncbi:hypothetical protein EX895_001614 [Sporisorium graminicola]|uniref:Sensitive to high expression protein 9, mitochondrial n=1 Tax=Sporisorium graminicola TaxID=280036 RepID=A0A4U7KWR4_9BASI|nr:hypothetical protein EX895_001614 [Sporisorium graminicola]TKY89083.1 hypothetical protein EX895_001614 [Sporisorium graminicola]